MLLPRILTGVIGIPLLLWLIHLGSLPFLVFVVGIATLALYEYSLILWIGGRGVQRLTVTIGGGLLALSVALGTSGTIVRSDLSAMVITAVVLAVILREMFRKEHSLERASITLFGIFFVGWTLAHVALLRDLRPHGERLTFFLFATIWATDIAAYAVGKTLGSKRLAPEISPKKTWEGAAAGLGGALLFSLISHKVFLGEVFGLKMTLLLGLLIGIVGQVSDLAESVIKRTAGVKDSSNLLPGHGGVLDRFDSFLLTAPIMYYAIILRQ